MPRDGAIIFGDLIGKAGPERIGDQLPKVVVILPRL